MTSIKNKPPYLTQGEVISEIAKTLGTKLSNKKIDDYAKSGDANRITPHLIQIKR